MNGWMDEGWKSEGDERIRDGGMMMEGGREGTTPGQTTGLEMAG